MNNVTLDTTNFSEQLGLYDFFDVIVSGAVFVFGISSLSNTIKDLLWTDITILDGLGILLVIYISGVVLQELSSTLDYRVLHIKHFTRSTFLFDLKKINTNRLLYWFSGMFKESVTRTENSETDGSEQKRSSGHSNPTGLWDCIKSAVVERGKEERWNWVLNNQLLLCHYRELAKQIYEETFPGQILETEKYNDEKFNSFIFSIIQYRVACIGKDKKVEKMRALYSLSRTLMLCFGLFVFFIPLTNWVPYLKAWLKPQCGCFTNTFFVASLMPLLNPFSPP